MFDRPHVSGAGRCAAHRRRRRDADGADAAGVSGYDCEAVGRRRDGARGDAERHVCPYAAPVLAGDDLRRAPAPRSETGDRAGVRAS